jgi:hypothetical protein
MNSVEDQVRAATRAQASTLREVRPLRLPPPGTVPARQPGARAHRLKTWLTPVTAAAVVVALAISLVIIRDLPNGRVVPPAGQAHVAAGVPKYYVALHLDSTKSPTSWGVLVGDTFTGARLATLAAPRGSTFDAVTGAADDRTFVLDALHLPLRGGYQSPTWYLLRLRPGASSPVQLTRLPIPATPGWLITALALSASGRELAVSLQRQSTAVLRIYSVISGKLLHGWSTSDPSVVGTATGPVSMPLPSHDELTWVDGDRRLAFFTTQVHHDRKTDTTTARMSVRTLDVTAAGDALIADSRTVWSKETAASSYTFACLCGQVLRLTADGKTVLSVNATGPVPIGKGRARWTLAWLAYSTSAPQVARVQYKLVRNGPARTSEFGIISTPWADASGDTQIIEWVSKLRSKIAHFGVLSHGTFTPLPSPPDVFGLPEWLIAW